MSIENPLVNLTIDFSIATLLEPRKGTGTLGNGETVDLDFQNVKTTSSAGTSVVKMGEIALATQWTVDGDKYQIYLGIQDGSEKHELKP